MALTNKLTAIADAIREKGNTTDLLTLDAMPAAIAALEVGGGSDIEPPVISGNVSELFKNLDSTSTSAYSQPKLQWYYNNKSLWNSTKTENITNAKSLFGSCEKLEEIPFTINIGETCSDCGNMFDQCRVMKRIPVINGLRGNCSQMFSGMWQLEEIGEEDLLNMADGTIYGNKIFYRCERMRKVPPEVLKALGADTMNYSNSIFQGLFMSCYALDEALSLPVRNATIRGNNQFVDTFYNCYHIKDITFATKINGSPKEVIWDTQTLDLSQCGYGSCGTYLNNTKEIIDDATYEQYYNDPDAWTKKLEYSRYDKASALRTIASLPIVYRETIGGNLAGSCILKMKSAAGSNTIGGSIGSMTEEEIAVASAKGWTISLA